jgi:hypothetical protein
VRRWQWSGSTRGGRAGRMKGDDSNEGEERSVLVDEADLESSRNGQLKNKASGSVRAIH